MKNSSKLIAKNVYSVNAYYTKKQNKTKELFFRCIREKRSETYFKKEAHKIWGNIDHEFMDKQIEKLMGTIHNINVEQALQIGRIEDAKSISRVKDWVIDDEYFKLTPEEYFNKFEKKFETNASRIYKKTSTTPEDLESDRLEKILDRYDKNVNQRVTYFSKLGKPIRQVQLSSYLSMVHNVNLTRAGWNQTMADSERIENEYFIIPFHPFSCPICYSHQNKLLTRKDVKNYIGETATEKQGDLLHPNCKCTLSIYWDESQLRTPGITEANVSSLYKSRQKVNSLTLEKSRLLTDSKIAKESGNMSAYDEYRKRINAINRTIREIKAELPGESLRKQITAIKR